MSFKANVTSDTRKHAKLRCQRHGKLRWRGDVMCEKCERVYLRSATGGGPGEAKLVIFPSAPETGNCDCGVRLFPKHENEDGTGPVTGTYFSARAICEHCVNLRLS